MKNEEIKKEEELIEVVTENTPLFADDKKFFTSINAESFDEKKKLYKAMNNPNFKIADCINKVINAKDIFVEFIEVTNEETGELTTVPRTIILDEKGESYQAVSVGIYNSLKKLIAVFGKPTWKEPIPLEIKQVTSGTNKILTFDIK